MNTYNGMNNLTLQIIILNFNFNNKKNSILYLVNFIYIKKEWIMDIQ